VRRRIAAVVIARRTTQTGAAMQWLNRDMDATNYESAMSALTVPTLFIGGLEIDTKKKE
jgi:hypothetical protein